MNSLWKYKRVGDTHKSNKSFLTEHTTTTVKLHSHRYALMPSCWSKTDVASPDWRIQDMKHNTVFICVASEFLN